MSLRLPGISNGQKRKVQDAVNYVRAFREEIEGAMDENAATILRH